MRYRIRVTPSAANQIRDAAAWWYTNRPQAPSAMAEELERAFELVAAQPRIGVESASAKLVAVRRVLLSRVRYYLYYRVRAQDDALEVLAFRHSSRGAEPDT